MPLKVVRYLRQIVIPEPLEIDLPGDGGPAELVVRGGLVGHLRPVAGPARLHHHASHQLAVVARHYLVLVEAGPRLSGGSGGCKGGLCYG
jgi:hypothetical protein